MTVKKKTKNLGSLRYKLSDISKPKGAITGWTSENDAMRNGPCRL